jgi:alcohol dehydrogenase class IV
MDSAKLAAAMATNKGDVENYCAAVDKNPKPLTEEPLPKIMIPTTSGTGSEASNTLVIIDGGYKTWITDAKLLADIAIIDPVMTLTCPPEMTAGSGMDALSHLGEAVMVRKWNPISDTIALKGINLVARNLRKAYYDGDNLEARWGMSLAAMLGGWVIGFPWVGGPATIGHCISEALGPKWGIPHGVACAVSLPYSMSYNLPVVPERIRLIGEAMGVETGDLNDFEAGGEAIRAVVELADDVGISLIIKDYKVPKGELKSFAEYIVNERQYMYDLKSSNPRSINLQDINLLIEGMWKGEI